LGEGAQNHVFLVKDDSGQFQGEYALKRLKHIDKIQRLETEIIARKKLDHSGIPKIVDYDLKNSPPYLVEEFVNGPNLSELTGKVSNNLIESLRHFVGICKVVDHAHNRNVIHRDLNPKNIIFDKDTYSYKITDFGICFVQDPETRERFTMIDERVGTRYFMAPELEQGRIDDIKPSSDIYSLGKILYWLLTGKIVTREDFMSSKMNLRMIFGSVQLERVNRLLESMIVFNPDERFQFVSDITKRIDAIIPLIEKNYNVIDRYIPQKCNYCGQGLYKTIAEFDPEKSEEPNYFYNKKAAFSSYGIEMNNYFRQRLLCCEECGHLQMFILDPQKRAWQPNP